MKTIHYFSPWLKSLKKYQSVWAQIKSALTAENEIYDFVPNAADIWVRDFMPFQRHDGEFVIYRYNPDYLQGTDPRYITSCRDAFISISKGYEFASSTCNPTKLIIDGGNMIRCTDKDGVDCVIMTTKVLYENPELSHHEILLKLEDKFKAQVIFIPWDTNEKYGHADSMVRSLSKGRLLINCYADMDPQLGIAIKKALGNRFEIQELMYGNNFREKSWCHLNYLELKRAILVPTANLASDNVAISQLESITGKKCIPISMSKIISEGGAMHCISWSMNTQIFIDTEMNFWHSLLTPQCH
ncbi:MAG: agmatine deiminase family protein [Bacteroidales bacterium]|nr:agmatine deiminase family protein [Bacteroidales bacterium]